MSTDHGVKVLNPGDLLTVEYIDVNGEVAVLKIEARAIALVVKEVRTGDETFFQPGFGENVFMRGGY